jgi:hypothetical protein
MKTRIVGFRPDREEPGAWIAVLACGHTQHVRHAPPLSERPWVLTEEGRSRFLGAELDCPYCDLPNDMPAGAPARGHARP